MPLLPLSLLQADGSLFFGKIYVLFKSENGDDAVIGDLTIASKFVTAETSHHRF